jgi:hypothetical protein
MEHIPVPQTVPVSVKPPILVGWFGSSLGFVFEKDLEILPGQRKDNVFVINSHPPPYLCVCADVVGRHASHGQPRLFGHLDESQTIQ